MARKMIEIPEEVMREVKRRKKREKGTKVYKRLLFLEMKRKKKLNKDIAELLDVTVETLSHWTGIFAEGGVELLCQLHYEGRRKSVMEPYKEEIKKHIKAEQVTSLKCLQSWLKNELEISVGISWLQEFCKKNSIFLTKKHD